MDVHGEPDWEAWDIWRGGDPEKVWARYFETLGEAARTGMFDILAHPDLVKVFGDRVPVPDGDLRRFYERAMDGIAESDVAIEVSTAGLRKPVGEIYPAAPFLEMCLDAGRPVALSSDAHTPEQLGHEYERAVEWLSDLGVTRAGGVRGPRAPAGADRMSERAPGIGWDSHRLEAGRRLVLGGVEIEESEAGLAGHSDADVLTHAVIDALLGAAGLGDIGQHFPDTDERWKDADSLDLLRAHPHSCATRALRDHQHRRNGRLRRAKARPLSATRCAPAWPRRRARARTP